MLKSILFLFLLLILAAPVWSAQDDMETETDPVLTAINIEGNSRTSSTLIKRIMGLKLGQTLNLDQTDLAWDALEDCGYFRFVEIDFDDSTDGEVVLDVVVEEDMTTFFGPKVRYSRRNKYLLGAWIEQRNLRGRGETLRADISAYYIQNGLVSWKKPWLFGVDGLEGTLSAFGQQAGFVFRPFRYYKWDLDWQMKWNFAGPIYALAGADYGYFRQRDSYYWKLPDRGTPPPPTDVYYGSFSENHWVFRGGIGVDTRSNPYYPEHGVYVEGLVSGFSSNYYESYVATSLDTRFFIPMPLWSSVMALRAYGRTVDGPTNIDNALYYGGPMTVRGNPYASVEGEKGYLLTAEYRLPLFLMPISPNGEIIGAGLHFFVDAGDAWFYGAEAGRSMLGYGAGIDLSVDTLQLRFEAARSRDGAWMFEFADKFSF